MSATRQELITLGAKILRRYRHPESWEDGSRVGKSHLIGSMTLLVEELRLSGRSTDAAAHVNAHAIRTWAKSVGIEPYQLKLDARYGLAPRIYVPNEHWAFVLEKLRELKA